MVAGILLNEETPSWGDGAVAVTIYAGQSSGCASVVSLEGQSTHRTTFFTSCAGLRLAAPRINLELNSHDHAKEEKRTTNGYVAEAYQPTPTLTKPSENPYPFLVDYLPQSVRPVLKSILSSPESRPIFYFLLLNLVYLFVQLAWGAWSNSLGLISDAVHMAFDCAALGVGLAASVMARWEKGGRWTYG